MVVHFSYDKGQVLQALRYHFISRPEIRIMLIIVNVFALICAVLYYFKRITPVAVLTGSLMASLLVSASALVMKEECVAER